MAGRLLYRRLRRGLYLAIGICVILPMAAYGFAQTEAGRGWIAQKISQLASADDIAVRVTGLGRHFPWTLAADRITAVRDGKTLADLQDTTVIWKPWSLLTGMLHVTSFTASSLEVRLDDDQLRRDTGEDTGSSGVPLDIRLDGMKIDRVVMIGPDGVRPEASVTANLEFRHEAGDLEVMIDVQRLDKAGHVRASLKHRRSPAQFDLRADILDTADGLIGTLAGLPGFPETSIRINGSGPADNWRGKIDMTIGTASALGTDLTVSTRDETRVSIVSSIDTGRALPQEISSLIGTKAALTATLRLDERAGLSLESFDLVSDKARLEIAGAYTPAGGALTATGRLKARQIPRSPILGGISSGELDVEVRLNGTFEAPEAEISGTVQDLSLPDVAKISKLGLSGTVGATKGFSFLKFDTVISADGIGLSGLKGDGQQLASSRLSVSGDIANLETLTLKAASLASPLVDLEVARGDIDFASGVFKLFVEARVPDLAALPGARPHLAGGALRIESEIDGNLHTALFEASPKGRVTDLKPAAIALPAELSVLDFAGQVRSGVDGGIELKALQVHNTFARLSVDAWMDPGSGRSTVRARGDIEKLEPLSAILAAPVRGSARLDVSYDGKTHDSGKGQISVSLDRPAVGPVSFDAATVSISGTVLDGESRGDLELGVRGNGKTVTLRTPYHLSPEAARFSALRLASNTASGNGDVTVPFAAGGLTGNASLKISDLNGLARVAGVVDFPGSGALDARLASSDGNADRLDFSVGGRNISWRAGPDPLKFGRLSASGSLANPFGGPNGTVQATVENVSMSGRTVRRITTNAVFQSARSADFDLAANGVIDAANDIGFSGRFEQRPADAGIRFLKLYGSIGTHRLSLGKAAQLDISSAGATIDFPDVRVGSGGLSITGTVTGAQISADASVKSLPLAIAGQLGLFPVKEGTLDLTAKLRGATGMPEADLSIVLSGVRMASKNGADIPVLAAEVVSSVRKGVLSAKAELSAPGLTSTSLTGRAGSDTLSIYRFDERTPVEMQVDGAGQLAPLLATILPEADAASGDFEIALSVAGSFSAPELSGTLKLIDANYENDITGATVRAVNARLVAKGRTIDLVSLAGSDGGAGAIGGRGSFIISASGLPEGSAELELTRFRIARRDDAVIDASGAFQLSASGTDVEVTGQASVDRADILIPEKLPDAVYDLDVEEIRDGQKVERDEPQDSQKTAFPINLDVSVDIPGKFFVQGRGLISEWKGKIRAVGDVSEPVIDGKLDIVKGTFAFAGKQFTIRDGTITLPKGQNPDTQLSVTADARVGDVVAKVSVAGTATSPSISFSSDPSLPREEILSLILFGKSSARLSALQAAQLGASVATLSGASGTEGIFGRVRRATGLDVIDIDSGDGDLSGSTLRAGKYVADGVFVSAGQGLSPGSGKVGVEIEVTPNISVNTETGSGADSSLGISLKFDF